MSTTADTFITRPIRQHGIKEKRENHILFERLEGMENIFIKGKKIPEKEILDNYRYFEIKDIKENHSRSRSIVQHIRLSTPAGKRIPFNKEFFNTNMTFKRPILKDISGNNSIINNSIQSKYSTTTKDKNYLNIFINNKQNLNLEQFSSNTQRTSKLRQNRSDNERYNRYENKGKNGEKIYSNERLNLEGNKSNENRNLNLPQNIKYENVNVNEVLNLNQNQKEKGHNNDNQKIMKLAPNTRINLDNGNENFQYNFGINQSTDTPYNINKQPDISLNGNKNIEKGYGNINSQVYKLEQNQNEKGEYKINKQEQLNLSPNQNIEQEYKNENIQRDYNFVQNQNPNIINNQENVIKPNNKNLEKENMNDNIQKDYNFVKIQNQYNQRIINMTQSDNLEQNYRNKIINKNKNKNLKHNKNKKPTHNIINQDTIQLSQTENLEPGFKNLNIQKNKNLKLNKNKKPIYNITSQDTIQLSQTEKLEKDFKNKNIQSNYNLQQNQNQNQNQKSACNITNQDTIQFSQNANLEQDFRKNNIQNNQNKKGTFNINLTPYSTMKKKIKSKRTATNEKTNNSYFNLEQNQRKHKALNSANIDPQEGMNNRPNIKSKEGPNLNQNEVYNNNINFRQNPYEQNELYLQQNRYNYRTYNKNQKLPFYHTSEGLKYKTQTENKLMCKHCGKQKKTHKTNKYKRGGSLEAGRKDINKEIINPQDYYVIRYNEYNDLNNEYNVLNNEYNDLYNQDYFTEYDWQIQEMQLNENEQGFEDEYTPQNIYYYSLYGYT